MSHRCVVEFLFEILHLTNKLETTKIKTSSRYRDHTLPM